ncbi:MAG: DUF2851 family protein [Limisphaerales bacterium]
MSSAPENFYVGWRARRPATQVLRDEDDAPSERLLQSVWQHQRLRRDQLKTTGGKTVRILHPGFVSVEGGPDFRDAIIQVGDEPPITGDVEIDLRAAGWRAHGHDQNKNFENVILHVVWDEVGGHVLAGQNFKKPDKLKLELQPLPPTLSLKPFLDAPLAELSRALENEPLRSLPESLRGKCCAPLRELNEVQLADLLGKAAEVRFQFKAEQMLARARNSGWEQALWENLFRALGYKHNAWPMQNLAETKSHWRRDANSAFEIQARLLGVSGLLPVELTRAQKSSDTFLRRAWDLWWRERDEFESHTLPRNVWKFHGLRPANHPQRRLALASHWLIDGNFISKIENWCTTELPDKKLLASLHDILQVQRDEFWSWHWTFKSARMKNPSPLLGDSRVTDLAVNVILPWLWVRAVEGKNEKLRQIIERRFSVWPAAEDNSVLKLARQRLLGTEKNRVLRTAAAQQGLIQIVRDFCEHSNALCENCRFPELVRGWNAQSVI